MLWTLNGTLKCEPTPNGMRAEISGIRYPETIFFSVILTLGAPWVLLDGHASGGIALGQISGAVLMACVGLAVLAFNIKSGSTIVTLDTQELKIERHRFGVAWRSRRFPTVTVRNLGYLPPKPPPWFSRQRGLPGEVCFDTGKKMIRFGAGIDYDDAETLIREMNRVQRFPWDMPEP
jgi:hypothetical protein